MNTLHKSERICSKRDIEVLFGDGENFFRHPFKVFYKPNRLQFDRIIVSVRKRDFKRAVKRNLIKRRIRESYRLSKADVAGSVCYDIAFVYLANEILTFEKINEKIRECMERIRKSS